MFWSNNGKGNCVDLKTVESVLEKYDEPPCILDLITTSGKIQWKYSFKDVRDKDAQELRKLRDEIRATNK